MDALQKAAATVDAVGEEAGRAVGGAAAATAGLVTPATPKYKGDIVGSRGDSSGFSLLRLVQQASARKHVEQAGEDGRRPSTVPKVSASPRQVITNEWTVCKAEEIDQDVVYSMGGPLVVVAQ